MMFFVKNRSEHAKLKSKLATIEKDMMVLEMKLNKLVQKRDELKNKIEKIVQLYDLLNFKK